MFLLEAPESWCLLLLSWSTIQQIPLSRQKHLPTHHASSRKNDSVPAGVCLVSLSREFVW